MSWSVAGPPTWQPRVPVAVQRLAGGVSVKVVWENVFGGLTFELGHGTDRRFVKWAPADSGLDLAAEVERLRWASAFVPVPRVLDHGLDATGSWLLTAALPGGCAVSEQWKRNPDRAVAALGRGLRILHDTLPTESCPFSWTADQRLVDVRRLADEQLLDTRRWHADHQALTVSQALAVLNDAPPVDELVVCHGDACAPNTLIDDRGCVSGYVDLGSLGVADRWADLAIATWSTDWNYGPGWEHVLLNSYGIAPDARRTTYYRLLWDLSP